MDLQDAGCHARFLIRDRDGKYPALFDAILADTGTQVVLSGVRVPRMNAIMERWIQTCRRELLDRTLVWNQRHLLHALRHTSSTTTLTARTAASTTTALCSHCRPRPPTPTRSRNSTSADAIASAGLLHEYEHAA